MFSKLIRPQTVQLLYCNRVLINHNVRQFQRCLQTDSTQQDLSNERIYYGDLTPRIKAVKVFSLTTSITGLAAQPIIMEQGSKIGGAPMMYFLCGFVGFFTFVTPFLLHLITNKYVTEMFYNQNTKEYTAVTISFFLRKIETKFKLEDVKVPEVPGMFTSFVVNGKTPIFVDAKQFTDTEHYIKMMGYDKPMDLKLSFDEKDNDSKEKK